MINVDQFRTLEEALWIEDPSGRDQILGSEFQEFCRFGDVYDRDHIVNSDTSGIRVDFPFDDFTAEQLADTVVLVTYVNTVHKDGKSQRARRASVWVNHDSEWKLRFQQATTLPDSN